MIFQDNVSTVAQADMVAGRGVGLTAVRAAVIALGGNVSVFSEAGKGTQFLFTLPRL
jgi:two-component system chemotaxis sensor kinase CheA